MTARLEAFGKPVIAAVNGIGKPPAICAPGGRRRSFPRKIKTDSSQRPSGVRFSKRSDCGFTFQLPVPPAGLRPRAKP
jgi:hypothetical protein